MSLKATLPSPTKPNNIPEKSQWLAGEGAGSWFFIENKNDFFLISRFSPTGDIECSGKFKLIDGELDFRKEYSFEHISHCQQVRIKQATAILLFERINE